MSAETRTTSSTGGQKGSKVERYDLIPVGPLRALATHFGKGARKYADGQWRKGYPWSLTTSALMRHLEAFREGLEYDICSNDVPEACSFVTNDGEPYEPTEPDTCYNHTGSHHIDAVMWHSFVLREFIETHPEHDDRHSTIMARTAAEEEAALLAEQVKLDRNAIWFIPEEPQFGRFVDMGFTSEDPGLTADEATRMIWNEGATMTFALTEVHIDTLRLAMGLPVREARFSIAMSGEVEDLDPLGLINEALQKRD